MRIDLKLSAHLETFCTFIIWKWYPLIVSDYLLCIYISIYVNMYITWHHLENALLSKFTSYYLLFTFTLLLFKGCYLRIKETKQRIVNIYSKWLWCVINSSAYENYIVSFHSQSNLLFSALCLWYQDGSPSALPETPMKMQPSSHSFQVCLDNVVQSWRYSLNNCSQNRINFSTKDTGFIKLDWSTFLES